MACCSWCGSAMRVPPLPSVAEVKLAAVYWPSSVRLAALPPAETVSVPEALAPPVVYDQPMVGWSANTMLVRSSRSVAVLKGAIGVVWDGPVFHGFKQGMSDGNNCTYGPTARSGGTLAGTYTGCTRY